MNATPNPQGLTPIETGRRGLMLILSSPSGDAVDVSGWRVAGPATAALPPGTVVPPGGAVAVGRDPGKAKAPQGGPVLGFKVEDVAGVGGGPAVVSRPA